MPNAIASHRPRIVDFIDQDCADALSTPKSTARFEVMTRGDDQSCIAGFERHVEQVGFCNSSIGTRIPRAARTAKAQMIQTGEFGAQSATAVPRPIPLWRSP